tara:strand:- start:1011 stop:2087 length:1077 start_codon:yes stop_codon:yes gene_type:complete
MDPIPTEMLEQFSLSALIVGHMLERLDNPQVNLTKKIIAGRIEKGENDLRDIYQKLKRRFLRTHHPVVQPFTNYADYLRFLYQEQPADLDSNLERLVGREAELIGIYPGIILDRGRYRRPAFTSFLEDEPLSLEVAYSEGTRKGRQAALIMVRRKCVQRAIEKIAYRLLCWGINEEQKNPHKKKPQKNPIVDDWFGIKVVTYKPEQAERVFEHFYTHLEVHYQLKADIEREKIYDEKGKVTGFQSPGVDNHYLHGDGKDNLIQTKVISLGDYDHGLREVVFTDAVNMLIDEMDHIRFRSTQKAKIREIIGSKKYKKIYRELVRRGMELTELLPERQLLDPDKDIYASRQRIILPGRDF